MEKLTIEHLVPYLPYELKVYIESETYYEKIGKLVKIQTYKNEFSTNPICILMNSAKYPDKYSYEMYYPYNEIKPILRPLSDLIKEINDKKIDTELELIMFDLENDCGAYDEWLDSYFDNPIQERIMQSPYELVIELLKRHYDIYGLIEKGLAININEI